MQVLDKVRYQRSHGTTATEFDAQGLAGWVMGLLRGVSSKRMSQEKQLRLVETLGLGGKRQLMLVDCGGQSFLIGCGTESVDAIVRVNADASPDGVAKRADEPCG